jgi:hypothetical protein
MIALVASGFVDLLRRFDTDIQPFGERLEPSRLRCLNFSRQLSRQLDGTDRLEKSDRNLLVIFVDSEGNPQGLIVEETDGERVGKLKRVGSEIRRMMA